jgi:Arc/MetJ-type ribon-helix-helix transcriptional regulator
MVTIHLTDDLERIVQSAVRTGRYASEDDVVRDALLRLAQTTRESTGTAGQTNEPGQEGKLLTKTEFHRHLVTIGLMDRVPDSKPAPGDPDAPLVDHEGEIISEMVIRERLIEWLAGFL